MRFRELCKAKNQDFQNQPVPTAAFFGDSVTEGCFGFSDDVRGTLDYDSVYHNQFRQMMQQIYEHLTLNILNAGVGGDSTASGLARIERDVLRFHPDLCVVAFGLNDTGAGKEGIETYRDNMRQILRILKENEIEAVVLTPHMMCTSAPHFFFPNDFEEYAAKIAGYMSDGTMDAYMQAARDVAKEEGAYLCDCYALWRKMQQAGVNTDHFLDNKINHISRVMHGFVAKALVDLVLFSE